jgi:quercetin dioxygenase-like cupin family protein
VLTSGSQVRKEYSVRGNSASEKGRWRNPRVTIAVALGAGFLVLGGVAVATPGIGILFAPVHARGTLDRHQVVNSKSGIHLKTKGSVDVATQQIVIDGGGSTGWHSHPGPVLVTVKSGTLRLIYADDPTCEGTVYEAGDSFIDRGDAVTHIARNESVTRSVELWATYLVPGSPGTAFRIDVSPAPSSC